MKTIMKDEKQEDLKWENRSNMVVQLQKMRA